MLEVGMKAPNFTLPDKNGNMVSLSDFLALFVFSIKNNVNQTFRFNLRCFWCSWPDLNRHAISGEGF